MRLVHIFTSIAMHWRILCEVIGAADERIDFLDLCSFLGVVPFSLYMYIFWIAICAKYL